MKKFPLISMGTSLLALLLNPASADPAPPQFLMTVTVLHAGQVTLEGPLIIQGGSGSQPGDAQYSSVTVNGYPAIQCLPSTGKTTRVFRSDFLKSGYALSASARHQGKIKLHVQHFAVQGVTPQVLDEMKKPIDTCHNRTPHQLMDLDQTIDIPRTDGVGSVVLDDGDTLRYDVQTLMP